MPHRAVKLAGAIAATIVFASVAAPLLVYVLSEATIERRYPLNSAGELAAPVVSAARGMHLVEIAGCRDCHAADLEGRRFDPSGPLRLWSSNLRRAATEMNEEEFARALRRGIAADATSLWEMPSLDYTYLSASDLAGILALLRATGPAGMSRPPPSWSIAARIALLDGRIVPAALAARDAPSSLDLGPRYDGGRYLARIACSECHGADLAGSPAGAPDLKAIDLFSRPGFFDLLRAGKGMGRRLPVMQRLSLTRFHFLADYEIMALYDYLAARAHAPPTLLARARANAARRKAAAAAESDN